MQGRLTSKDPARNAAGVLYSDLLKETKKTLGRLIKAQKEALEAWLRYAKEKEGRKKVGLVRKAKDLTDKAMG